MPRYIDAEKLCKSLHDMAFYQNPYKQSTILGVVSSIENFPTADVAPKSEVAREIFEEVDSLLDLACHMIGIEILSFPQYTELKKKYAEDPAEDRQSSNKSL